MKNNIFSLHGRTEKIGEALAAEASVNNAGTKVWFRLPGTMGTVTWDVKNDRWYGSARLIPSIKKAFSL